MPKKKNEITKIREWYNSYETAPPWSSVAALVERKMEEAERRGYKKGIKANLQSIKKVGRKKSK